MVMLHVFRCSLLLDDHLLSTYPSCLYLFFGEALDGRDGRRVTSQEDRFRRARLTLIRVREFVEIGHRLSDRVSVLDLVGIVAHAARRLRLRHWVGGRTENDVVLVVVVVERGHHRRLLIQRQTPVLRTVAVVDLRLKDANLLVGLLIEIVRQSSRGFLDGRTRPIEFGQGDGRRLDGRVLHGQAMVGHGREASLFAGSLQMPVDLRGEENPESENNQNVNDLEDEREKQEMQARLKVEQEDVVHKWHLARRVQQKNDDGNQAGTVVRTAIVARGLIGEMLVRFEAIVGVVVEGDRRDVNEKLQEKVEEECRVRLIDEQVADVVGGFDGVVADVLQEELKCGVHETPLQNVESKSKGVEEGEQLGYGPEDVGLTENTDRRGKEKIEKA